MSSPLARHWTLDSGIDFLNHGSFGACPRVVLQRQAQLRDRIESQPVEFLARLLPSLLDEARERPVLDLLPELLLAAEVMHDQAVGALAGLADPRHGGTAETALDKQLLRCIENGFAGGFRVPGSPAHDAFLIY